MLRGVTLVDPDGVVSQQTHLMRRYTPSRLATTPPPEQYRYFLPRPQLRRLCRQLSPARGLVVLVGPGCLHHLTAALVALYRTELCLVVFDAHPDWAQPPPGYIHCGSWVREVLAMPHVRRVVLVGTGLLDAMGMLQAPLARELAPLWRAGRLYVLPARACTARELQRALGLERAPVSLEEGLQAAVDRLAAMVEDAGLYISVDKDVLDPQVLPGVWPGGWLQVDQLGGLVEELVWQVGKARLVGADICGECEGWLARAPGWMAVQAHEQVNLRLLSALLEGRPQAASPWADPRRPLAAAS